MARGHSVATVVIDATDQQGLGFRACDRVIVALVVEFGLHRVKEITLEDGGLLAGEDLPLEGDLADVEPIAQKMGERTAGEWDPASTYRNFHSPGSTPAPVGNSFDHLVGAREQRRWNGEAESGRCLEIDDEFDLRRLLYRQLCGLCTLQDFIHVDCCSTVLVGDVGSVAHEPAIFDMLAITINRR